MTDVPRADLFSNDALLLIAHGSARYPDAGRTAHLHAETIRAQGHFASVGVGFLNGAPPVAEALAALAPRFVHVVPFFMEDGYFTRVAVPTALTGIAPDRLRLYPPVGLHPGLSRLIEARAAAAGGSLVLIGHGSARAPGRPMALHGHAERLRAGGRFADVAVAFLEEAPFAADVLARADSGTVAVAGVFAGDGMHVRDDLPALIAAARTRLGARLHDLGSIGDDPGMADLMLDQVLNSGPTNPSAPASC
jgi:sirohydrochlorin cobaltochelatase